MKAMIGILGYRLEAGKADQGQIAENDAEQQFAQHRRESRCAVPAARTVGR
jgi:hypothetical protein